MQRLTFGSITVDAVVDGELGLPVAAMFANTNPDRLREFGGVDDAGVAKAQLSTFVIRAGGRLILVDTGIGSDLGELGAMGLQGTVGLLPGALVAAGIQPDAVDAVILTHVHGDHIGWNTTESGGQHRPTFPNARYIITRTEWAARAKVAGGAVATKLTPIEASGQLELVDDGHEVAPGVSLLATPGHTPGHTSVLVFDGGSGGIVTGDVVHHPIEIIDPDIVVPIDSDAQQSIASRKAMIARAAADGLVVMGGHFPPPTAGYVTAVEGKRTWKWVGA